MYIHKVGYVPMFTKKIALDSLRRTRITAIRFNFQVIHHASTTTRFGFRSDRFISYMSQSLSYLAIYTGFGHGYNKNSKG
jgi:hypothetical protein